MAAERAEWTGELKRLRHVLEIQAQQSVASQPPTSQSTSGRLPQPVRAAFSTDDEPDQGDPGDPVLDSVMAQFEMLQKDLVRRRAKRAADRQKAS
jgi:hypothetical protein